MEWFILIAVAVVVLLGVLARFSPASSHSGTASPYLKTRALLTPAERSFLGVLDQALGNEFRVMGKVRVADVLSVRSGMNRSAWQQAFNKISAKHFDFLLCNPNDLSVFVDIELRAIRQPSQTKADHNSGLQL